MKRKYLMIGIMVLLAILFVILGIFVYSKHVYKRDYQINSEDITYYSIGSESTKEHIIQVVNKKSISAEDKAEVERAIAFADEYPISIQVIIHIEGNKYPSKTAKVNTTVYYSPVASDTYYFSSQVLESSFFCDNRLLENEKDRLKSSFYFYLSETDILNRCAFLWLNDNIDCLPSKVEYSRAMDEIVAAYQNGESIDAEDYEWVRKINSLNYSDYSNFDDFSKDNPKVFNLLYDNYMSYNSKLSEKIKSDDLKHFFSLDHYYDLFIIYKEYGDSIKGHYVNGEYVIDNYDEMFGELDKALMESFDLSEDDFR